MNDGDVIDSYLVFKLWIDGKRYNFFLTDFIWVIASYLLVLTYHFTTNAPDGKYFWNGSNTQVY